MMSDTELLDALDKAGNGIALLHDDVGHWYVVGDGFQSIPVNSPEPFDTTYLISDKLVPLAGKTVREALNNWLRAREESDR